jgi:hypothetical protein
MLFLSNEKIATLVWSVLQHAYPVVCPSSDEREETQYFPFRCWVNTRTPGSNLLKYLQSKNEYKCSVDGIQTRDLLHGEIET